MSPLFDTEKRRERREIDRTVKMRMGKNRIKRHVTHQQEMIKKLTELAKKALILGDEARFKQIGRQILGTRADINHWERYVLSLELLEARRDQAKASVDLLSSVKAMSDSMADLASPTQVADIQRQLEMGLARASSMEERLEIMMEMMDTTLAEDLPTDETSLQDLERGLIDQISTQETASFDREIEEGLKKIRAELEKK